MRQDDVAVGLVAEYDSDIAIGIRGGTCLRAK